MPTKLVPLKKMQDCKKSIYLRFLEYLKITKTQEGIHSLNHTSLLLE